MTFQGNSENKYFFNSSQDKISTMSLLFVQFPMIFFFLTIVMWTISRRCKLIFGSHFAISFQTQRKTSQFKPFPSSPMLLFQRESMWETSHRKMSSACIFMQIKVIFIWMVSPRFFYFFRPPFIAWKRLSTSPARRAIFHSVTQYTLWTGCNLSIRPFLATQAKQVEDPLPSVAWQREGQN